MSKSFPLARASAAINRPMAIDENTIDSLPLRARPYKVTDGGGLTLLVQPNGAKWWRFRYRIDGREKMLSLGTYPAVSLGRARALRDDARMLVADRMDPSVLRATSPRHGPLSAAAPSAVVSPSPPTIARQPHTVRVVAAAWLKQRNENLGQETLRRYRWVLRNHVIPHLGHRRIRSLRPADLQSLLHRSDASAHPETTRRVRQMAKQLIRHAVAQGQIEHGVATELLRSLARA